MPESKATASAAPSPDAVRRDRRTIALVGVAHGTSHFCQLLLAPLFPWIKQAFGLSYVELGLLMTTFFVVSGVSQAMAGFVVDRVGALPVLLGSLALLALTALGFSISTSYSMMLAFAALGGLANSPFHPVDFSIMNARVSPVKLGRAYAVHGISGNLGWAAAPVFLVGIAGFAGWRVALAAAAGLIAIVWLVVWRNRAYLQADERATAHSGQGAQADGTPPVGQFAFLRLPAIWLSFGFFFAAAAVLGGVQSFGPESAKLLHDVPLGLVALCLTAYMLSGAGGMLLGGVLASDEARAERIIAWGFGISAVVALLIGFSGWPGWTVPVLFAMMGFGSGIAGPSRDLLVRRATPPGATGRVYGMVYSGLDVGSALAPALFGALMDTGRPATIWIGIAIFQGLMIVSAMNIGRVTASHRSVAPAG